MLVAANLLLCGQATKKTIPLSDISLHKSTHSDLRTISYYIIYYYTRMICMYAYDTFFISIIIPSTTTHQTLHPFLPPWAAYLSRLQYVR